jgi:Domain of unknown function (DUF4157)
MKAIQTKTKAADPAKKTAPFFNKEAGQGFFKPARPGIQTKLTVGEPNDVYEKEADHTADQVVRGLNASPAAAEGSAGKAVRRKPIFESKNEAVQKKAAVTGAATASPAVESSLKSSKGGGSPLPAATKNQMESSFGTDFSGVRVHNDSAARKMNKDLNAQAFTHGKDIYFNGGKYNTGSSDGKRLLAHELTHVVQQTGGGTAGKKPVQRKAVVGGAKTRANHSVGGGRRAGNTTIGGPAMTTEQKLVTPEQLDENELSEDKEAINKRIQRAPATGSQAAPVAQTPAEKLAGIDSKMGEIVWDNKDSHKYIIVLKNFPLKKYKGVDNVQVPTETQTKPKGKRNTHQDTEWSGKVKAAIHEKLTALANDKEKKDFILVVKGGKKDKGESQLIGNLDTLTDASIVPFWNKQGKPTIHQIEHVIDYQIMGTGADKYTNNLILLDRETNRKQGEVVKVLIETRVQKLLGDYAKSGLPITKRNAKDVIATYTVQFKNLVQGKEEVAAESIILEKDIKEKKIISDLTLEIRDAKIPANHCVVRTAEGGAGYIVPYDYQDKDGIVKINGKPKKDQPLSITQTKLVKDSKHIVVGTKEVKLTTEFEKKDYYKLTRTGKAALLQQSIKLVGLSPIEFSDENIDVSPLTGIKAEGKVKPTLNLLKDADIGFSLDAAEFTVYGVIESDVLKGKLPSPLDIDYSSLTIAAGTQQGLSATGEIGFSIKNLGKGVLIGHVGAKGFGVSGQFDFDESKLFTSALLSFSYSKDSGEDGKWAGSGELVFKDKAIPGVKEGNISITYKEGVLSGAGSFLTSIPKVDRINVTAQFDKAGNFSISGDTKLKGVPGIKDSSISVTVTKDENGYSLAMAGSATPNLPNIPGLGATLTVSYNKGVFILEGKADYTKDKLEGSVTVGVTNAVVDENGVASKDTTDDKIKIYGNGAITLHLLKGVDATLQGAVDAAGEMFIWGDVNVVATPFDPVDVDKQIFDIKTSIPLVGIPFASINLDLGTGAKFYFHWDPLTIKLQATLDRTNIKDIGKAGGELTASLSSQAKAGFMVTVSAGVSVSVAIIKLGAHINGSVALELNAEVGAEAKAKWDMQKGLQLEEAEASLKGVPDVRFILSGDITADVDLWLTSYQVYKKEMTLAEKKLDLSQFAFGVTIPLKIDENGKVQGIDYSKLKVTPELDAKAGNKISDQVLNGDDRKKKEQKEKEAKDKIRIKVVQKLQEKKADGETNLREYASDLKSDIKDDTPDELAGMVDEVVEEELRKMEKANEPPPPPPANPNDPNQNVNTGGAEPAVATAAPQETPVS